MAVTVDDLKEYVGDAGYEYDSLLSDCLVEAKALVDKYNKRFDANTLTWGQSLAPEEIVDRCYLIVAADLFERRNAPNGIVNQQYGTVDGIGYSPMRIARDPLAGVYRILGRWVTPW